MIRGTVDRTARLKPYRAVDPLCSLDGVFEALSHLEQIYPGFRAWYFERVVPAVALGTRFVTVRRESGIPIGVAIAKDEGGERKLCTLWVRDGCRGRGIARALADEAFDWLGDRRPLFTVPEERMSEFLPLVTGWQFGEPVRHDSLYRDGRCEFVFNGKLGYEAH